jgi:hypothetical protein
MNITIAQAYYQPNINYILKTGIISKGILFNQQGHKTAYRKHRRQQITFL